MRRDNTMGSDPARRGRATSLSGGKVRTGHRVHGMKSQDEESHGGGKNRARSKSRDRKPKPRREYDTPFDDKGRCHYHVNVQLASKKFNGGWKVLHPACPKCMEDKQDGSGDDRSVKSGRSARSSSGAAGGGGAGAGGSDAQGKHDKNGCCALHPHIQVAKKRVLGSGWKVVRACPSCTGGAAVGLDDDDFSVKSGRSAKSNSSRKSTKSSRGGGGKSGTSTKSGRYGKLPFDGDGYCCRHPGVQVAQKKMMGGFKIIHDVCPECAEEDGGKSKKGSRRSRSKSRTRGGGGGGRSSSRHRRNSDGSDGSDRSSKVSKRRIRVKNLKVADEEGRSGRYSGYVNDDHLPHGNGVMKYEDGTEYDGVWAEGARVHGNGKKGRKKKSGSGKG